MACGQCSCENCRASFWLNTFFINCVLLHAGKEPCSNKPRLGGLVETFDAVVCQQLVNK